jgi:hypothetical protein
MFVQIPPLRTGPSEPENTIENKSMIPWPPPTMRPTRRDERLKATPFLIRHQSTNQDRLLQKATLNQKLTRLGILFVNRT